MPEISVIIPCYNQERYIAECLDSVLAQTFTDYEVIVVNDGSTDASLEIIKKYINQYSNFKLIDQTNQGVVKARNKAIEQASAKYIYPLDADDIIEKTLLEKSFNAINKHKGDIITTRVTMFGENTGEMYLPYPNKYQLASANCLVNAALFRKSDFNKTNGYDEIFASGLEDYDLWLNMVFRHKLKIYRIPEILFFYRIKNLSESRNKQQTEKYRLGLETKLLQKYPEIKIYRFYMKIQKSLFHISFRHHKKRIKILGITFYRGKYT